jgi:hypothetical protein
MAIMPVVPVVACNSIVHSHRVPHNDWGENRREQEYMNRGPSLCSDYLFFFT